MKYTVKLENDEARLYADDEFAQVLPLILKKDGNYTIKLPEETGRQWLELNKLAKYGEVELQPREKRVLGPRGTSKWQNYLTEEQKTILAEIEADCRARMEADKPDEKESKKAKLLARIAKLEAQLSDMDE